MPIFTVVKAKTSSFITLTEPKGANLITIASGRWQHERLPLFEALPNQYMTDENKRNPAHSVGLFCDANHRFVFYFHE